jgi:hypothetical protein
MTFESEYKLEDLPVTLVPSDKIDGTFRSSSIGECECLMSLMVTPLEPSYVGPRLITLSHSATGDAPTS